MRRIYGLQEVIRIFIYCLLVSLNVPLVDSQFDVTPFAYNDDDIKEPMVTNTGLIADYHDLQSMYDDTAQMLYNSTSSDVAPSIHQIYPLEYQQNYTNLFTNLLNNSNDGSSPITYNFSGLFPATSSAKNAYYKLPDTFRVYPSDRNFTLMKLTIPANMSAIDGDIFLNTINDSLSSDNGQEIYVNIPPASLMPLNDANNSNLLNQFFQIAASNMTSTLNTETNENMSTEAPVITTPTPWSSTYTTLSRPSINASHSQAFNSSLNPIDVLAKRIVQDATKNASSDIGDLLSTMGAQEVTTHNDSRPMYLYKINTTDGTPGNFNASRNYTIPREDFYFPLNGTDRPPTSFLYRPPNDNTSLADLFEQTLPIPISANFTPNGTIAGGIPLGNTTTLPIPYIGTTPLTANGSAVQGNLTYIEAAAKLHSNETYSFSAVANDLVSDVYGEIIYSSVYFISGSSTPPKPYPKDPYGNATYWPEGINELTNEGKRQLYELGRWLQRRYKSLIGFQYNSTLISIDSGATDIALMSAEIVAAGLFPPVGNQVWNPSMAWQPVPVRSTSTDEDNMILMSKSCQQYYLQIKDLNGSPNWVEFYKNNSATINYIGNNTGTNLTKDNLVNDLQTIFFYYQDLKAEEERHLPLPIWTRTVYPDKMMSLAQQYIEYAVSTRDLQKIKTGPFFQNIVNNMTSKIRSANSSSSFTQTLHLYSGDVFGMGFIMKTLGVYNSTIPPDASALIFDLRYKQNEFIVTVSYKNATTDSLYVLPIPQCEPICNFSQFVKITSDLIVDNWDSYCSTVSIFDLTYTIPIVIFGLAIIFILSLIVVLLVIKCCKNLRKKKTLFR